MLNVTHEIKVQLDTEKLRYKIYNFKTENDEMDTKIKAIKILS